MKEINYKMTLKKITKLIAILLTSLETSRVFSNQISALDQSIATHNFYITAGYSLTHKIYQDKEMTLSQLVPSFNYIVSQTYPNNLNGFRIGFGAKLGSSRHFGYEFDYNQNFQKTQNTPGLAISVSEKLVVGLLTYSINPESRFRFELATGAVVTSTYTTTATSFPIQPSYNYSNGVDVDPVVAGAILFQLSPAFAIKGVLIYDIDAYSNTLTGSVIPLLMLTYYPK